MNLIEAIQILKSNNYQINEKSVSSGLILYHGTRNGDLKIDYSKDNEIWLTPDIKMATDYAALKETRYGDYSLVKTFNKNSKRAVYKIKLNKSVNLADFTDKEERETFIEWYLENYYKKPTKKMFKDMTETLEMDYTKFLKYHVGFSVGENGRMISPKKSFIDILKEYGVDGFISNEIGYYNSENGRFGKGVSYYVFDLKNIEVVEKLDLINNIKARNQRIQGL